MGVDSTRYGNVLYFHHGYLYASFVRNGLHHDANQFTTLDPTLSQHLGDLGQHLGSSQAASLSWISQLTKQATINGITDAFWVATVLSALALILSLFLHGKKEPNLD
ncbi:hypothetical protein QK289_07545 [Exiguobacterium antarcticum]|uniref:Uncharacterized protein n=1 Tax=Exiguobacterium antarcticum TaxID=132920 RepID=A0ABT6R1M6_9BACL|nr:hypothetical protein [Exiguobacterium antarcticum]MDI3234860.1 hypothetical protein [Exiguobacterium antarcticum]